MSWFRVTRLPDSNLNEVPLLHAHDVVCVYAISEVHYIR